MARVELPVAEFGFPGELRDALVAAILRGEKTATSSLLVEYERGEEPLPEEGQQAIVVNSDEQPVGVIETTEVRVVPAGDIDVEFARDEGEGFGSVAEWRTAHERFWHSAEMRDALGPPEVVVGDGTLVVTERFRLVEDLRTDSARNAG